MVAQLAATVPVDLLPGTTDPANYTLPQQPLHHCLFPLSRTYPTFRLTTNPAQVECGGGVRVAGHAGQPTSDMARFSTAGDASELLERTLRWRHLAPSAPDTLACYPFQERDPFVIDEAPHVLFAGNQPAFSSRLVEEGEGDDARRVRAVAVPSFARTQSFVLVDLASDTLECHEVHISTPVFEARAAAAAAKAAKEAGDGADNAGDDEEEEDEEIPEPDGGDEGGDEA
jgi:DNA polymerase delta subunit 2